MMRQRPRAVIRWIGVSAVLLQLAACGGGNSSPNPASIPTATPSASSLSFSSTAVGQSSASQTITLSSTGSAALVIGNVAISGSSAASFTQTNTCGSSVPPTASCTLVVVFSPVVSGSLFAMLSITDNASDSPQTVSVSGTGTAASTFVASLSATSLSFPSTAVGATTAAQMIMLSNIGTGTIGVSGITIAGAGADSFMESNTCGNSLAASVSCSILIAFKPVSSGLLSATLSVADNAGDAPQIVSLTGTGSAITPLSVDCSVSTASCPHVNLQGDPIASGGFHGYADPAMRKDPNSNLIYFAYSWPHTLADGTHVVDLHLAASQNGGAAFDYVGPLYQSSQSTQSTSTAYASANDSSTETIDLLPIALSGSNAGQTLWVQAHQSYLVAPMTSIYNQLTATNFISVTAVQLTQPGAANAGAALLALGSASTPEARLGSAGTDSSRQPTQGLYSLSQATAKCTTWGQPALWYQSGILYLSLECTQTPGNGNIDANELAHFVYSTTPTGSDASAWAWAYVGEFATASDAAKLGTVEGATYAFFTEPEFVLTKGGQLAVLMTPSVFAPQGATQPVIQYGCRLIPVTLTPNSISLNLDATSGAPSVWATVTENDLYTSPNEGPAACTYDSASSTGIVIGRKYENDPTDGFYIYPVSSGLMP